jgi:hypothetical protein
VDPSAPAITALVGQPVSGQAIEVKGTGEAGALVKLYADGGSTAACPEGPHSPALPPRCAAF